MNLDKNSDLRMRLDQAMKDAKAGKLSVDVGSMPKFAKPRTIDYSPMAMSGFSKAPFLSYEEPKSFVPNTLLKPFTTTQIREDGLFSLSRAQQANISNQMAQGNNVLGNLSIPEYVKLHKNTADIDSKALNNDYFLKPLMSGYNQTLASQAAGRTAAYRTDNDAAIVEYDKRAQGYAYDPSGNLFGRGWQGMMNQAGQWAANYLSPEMAVAAPLSAVSGGFSTKAAMAKNAFEMEAGSIYRDLLADGVDSEAARTFALLGGMGSGAIEMVQLGSIAKGLKMAKGDKVATGAITRAIQRAGLTEAVEKFTGEKLGGFIKNRAIPASLAYAKNVLSETGQEMAQEAVAIGAENIAKKLSGIQTDSWRDMAYRIGQTGMDSATTFGVMGLGGLAGGMIHGNFEQKSDNNTLNMQNPNVASQNPSANAVSDASGIQNQSALESQRNGNQGYIPKMAEQVKQVEPLAAMNKNAQVKTILDVTNALASKVQFFEGDSRINGFFEDGVNYINLNGKDAISRTFGHELYHDVKRKANIAGDFAQLDNLENFLLHQEGAALLGEGELGVLIAQKMEAYRENGKEISPSQAREELMAEAIGRVFQDERALKSLAHYDGNLFVRAYRWIVDTIRKMGMDADARLLYDVQKRFEKVLREVYGEVDWEQELPRLRAQEGQGYENAASARMSLVGVDENGVRHYKSDYRKHNLPSDTQTILNNFKRQIENLINSSDIVVDGAFGKLKVLGDKFTVGKNERSINNLQNNPNRLLMMEHYNDLADILENARLVNMNYEPHNDGSVPVKNKYHKDVLYWHTFKSEVYLDGAPYEVIFDVREKSTREGFVYEIKVRDIQNAPTTVMASQTSTNKTVGANSDHMLSLGEQNVNHNSQNSSDLQYRKLFDSAVQSHAVSEDTKAEILRQSVESPENLMYLVDHNEDVMRKAKSKVAMQGAEGVAAGLRSLLLSGKAFDVQDAGDAIVAFTELSQRGDTKGAMSILSDLAIIATEAGKFIQALSMLKKMSAEGRLMMVERAIQRMNAQGGGKYEIVLSERAKQDILASEGNSHDLERAAANAMREAYHQLPSTLWDKWNAWRYLAMLGNPRTHIRNIVGNLMFAVPKTQKDLLAAAIESVVIGQKDGRTKSLKPLSKDMKLVANELYKDTMRNMATREGLNLDRRIFKNKLLEGAREWNSMALEAEDMFFMKQHFVRALGSYLNANGIKPSDMADFVQNQKGKRVARMKSGYGLALDGKTYAKIQDGIAYAVREAERATFRDQNKLASSLNKLSKSHRGWEVAIDSVAPFKQTPANILKRAWEYSPAGAFHTLGKQALSKNKYSTADFIDHMSSGVTGTFGIMALGAALASMGIVRAGGDDEEWVLDDLEGKQAYSVKIGDFSFTLDWAAPISLPFFVGVELYLSHQTEDSAADSIGRLLDALSSMGEPAVNMSMLQGLSKAINAGRYAESGEKALFAVGGQMAASYVSQGVPTILGQAARTIDSKRRTSIIDSESSMPRVLQRTKNEVHSKIPFANQKLPAYIDAFGREQSTGSLPFRAAQNFVLPFYVKRDQSDYVTEELRRMYEVTGEKSVLPKKADKKIKGDYGKQFNASEYEDYNKYRGNKVYETMQKVFKDDYYKKSDDERKQIMIEEIHSYAKALADEKYLGKPLDSSMADVKSLEKMGQDFADIMGYKLSMKEHKDVIKSDKVAAAYVNPFAHLTLQGQERVDFVLSSMSDTARKKYPHVMARGIADVDTFYAVYNIVMSRAKERDSDEKRTVEDKVRDLMRLGCSRDQAYALYKVISSTKKYM